jgi:hypothetical protein
MDRFSDEHHGTDQPDQVADVPFHSQQSQPTNIEPALLPSDAVQEDGMWSATLNAMWFELVRQ